MAVEWFDLSVDGLGVFDDLAHVATNERAVAVFETPDFVRLAKEVREHGGRVLQVIGTLLAAPCPSCRRDVRHWVLEDRFGVACCESACGFVSYRVRNQ